MLIVTYNYHKKSQKRENNLIMKSNVKVSIILPSLNVIKYIRQCLESVVNQTLKDIEIICVDAGSTDGTLEVIQEFAEKDSRIIVINSEKKSYGYQMNLGLDAASGEYLGIVETDDWVVPEMYQDLYQLCTELNLDFVKADFYRFTQNKDGSLNKFYNQLSKDLSYYNRIIEPAQEMETFHFIMNTWSGIYNIDFLRQWNIRHNETPGASYQDNGFWFQTFCRAQKAYFVNKPYYMNRRDNENSSVFSKGKIYSMRDEYDYIRNIIDHDLDNLGIFIPMCNYYRFCGYYYNTLFRIAPEFKQEVLSCMSKEFYKLANACELDKSIFKNWEWGVLMQIIYAPDQFYSEKLLEHESLSEKRYSFLDTSEERNVPFFSIIVPVYNVEKYLKDCLDSIQKQTFTNYEVICVNDGSTDNSKDIIQNYIDKDNRFTIINKLNGGLSSARNAGLERAKGKYICFIDSDDAIAPNALKILADSAEKDDADIVVFGMKCDYFPVYTAIPSWLETKNPVRNITFSSFSPEILFDEPGARTFVWRNVYKRDFLKTNNLFFNDAFRFGEDTIFQFCAFPNASNICFIKDRLYYYRCSRQNSLMEAQNKNQLQKCIWHIQIMSYIYDYWQQKQIFSKMRKQFSAWALSFCYNEMDSLLGQDKAYIAELFLNKFISICPNEKDTLGPGNQARVNEIRTWASVAYSDVEDLNTSFEHHTEVDAPIFSIIVPVHNMANTIAKTLASILNQTEDSIEVICVDDASTDGSADILRSITEIDKRLKVITYTENKTANQARKDGVQMASGKYILFCDADDSLEMQACEIILNEMKRDPVDILHFGTYVQNNNGSNEDKLWLDTHLFPFCGKLYNKDVFLGCFRDGLYTSTLWNKAYTSELAKKAFSQIEDGCFPRGQDIYAFFVLAYYAESYRGLPGNSIYHYNLATGMDGTKHLDVKQFASFCSFSLVIDAIKRFLEKEGKDREYNDIWLRLRSNMLGDCINKWTNKIDDSEKGACLDLMLQSWPAWMVTESIARRYWYVPKKDIGMLKNSMYFSSPQHTPKTIAMYYHKATVGGVEKVMESLCHLWTSLGYRVIIITDIKGPADAIRLPATVKRYGIPNAGIGNPEEYYLRAKQLQDIIESENIELLVYHAWNTALLPWDMLTTKTSKCSFAIHCHSSFTIRLQSLEEYFADMPYIFSLADAIICLSDSDKEYWNTFNSNVHKVLNPITIESNELKSAHDNHNVLYVGRLSEEKRPEDLIKIFALVLKEVSDAKLYIVGDAEDDEYFNSLLELAESLDLSEAIEWSGFQENVTDYYNKASVLVMTSRFEGFPLVPMEAMCFSLPIVMYELPYLEIVKDNRGIIQVPQGDLFLAAEKVVGLLNDSEKRESIGSQGRKYYEELTNYNYAHAWEMIFDSLSANTSDKSLDETKQLMWDTIFSSYRYGLQKQNEREQELLRTIKILEKKHKKAKNEIKKIKASNSYKIGRTATKPVRVVKKIYRNKKR